MNGKQLFPGEGWEQDKLFQSQRVGESFMFYFKTTEAVNEVKHDVVRWTVVLTKIGHGANNVAVLVDPDTRRTGDFDVCDPDFSGQTGVEFKRIMLQADGARLVGERVESSISVGASRSVGLEEDSVAEVVSPAGRGGVSAAGVFWSNDIEVANPVASRPAVATGAFMLSLTGGSGKDGLIHWYEVGSYFKDAEETILVRSLYFKVPKDLQYWRLML
ncbi:hypothetical protein DL95DRAFT_406617 [Leptodontidium sp. 2 PMI_412]|nr:hypothetical protein DL95DRAFT_406617 [Leptodontidium sp. 2 PMI_412]